MNDHDLGVMLEEMNTCALRHAHAGSWRAGDLWRGVRERMALRRAG